MLFGAGQGKRFRLFRVLGFPIFVESSVLILIVLFLFMGAGGGPGGTVRALVFILVAFVSIIIHELGHALAIRRLGYGGSTIVLHGLGGVCQWRGTPTRRNRIIIALAGPGAGFLVGGIVLPCVLIFGYPGEFLAHSAVRALLFINIGWGLFNLLPIWPLDGGHVVRAALAGRQSRDQATRLSLQVSMIAAGLVIAAALMYSAMFVAVLCGFILYSNYNEWKRLQGPPASFYGY
jgi:Zn-dependent protease